MNVFCSSERFILQLEGKRVLKSSMGHHPYVYVFNYLINSYLRVARLEVLAE